MVPTHVSLLLREQQQRYAEDCKYSMFNGLTIDGTPQSSPLSNTLSLHKAAIQKHKSRLRPAYYCGIECPSHVTKSVAVRAAHTTQVNVSTTKTRIAGELEARLNGKSATGSASSLHLP